VGDIVRCGKLFREGKPWEKKVWYDCSIVASRQAKKKKKNIGLLLAEAEGQEGRKGKKKTSPE